MLALDESQQRVEHTVEILVHVDVAHTEHAIAEPAQLDCACLVAAGSASVPCVRSLAHSFASAETGCDLSTRDRLVRQGCWPRMGEAPRGWLRVCGCPSP